jgi:hypothetical protein
MLVNERQAYGRSAGPRTSAALERDRLQRVDLGHY